MTALPPTMADRDGKIWMDGAMVDWRDANAHFLTRQPWESLVRQIRIGKLREHVA